MNSGSIYVVDETEALHESQANPEQLIIDIPEICDECKSNNFYLWGTNINKKLEIDVRCIKCGKRASKLESKT